MKTIIMTPFEYQFMTGRWEGPKGAAWNAVYKFCKEFGWIMGMSDHDEPIPTERGTAAIKAYKEMNNVG